MSASPTWTQAQAIDLCRKIEAVCPQYGCHVALTGGTLYRDGERKDADILFYRIRQVDEIDVVGLMAALVDIGIDPGRDFGWCHKATYEGRAIDFFFPERADGDYPQPDADDVGRFDPATASLPMSTSENHMTIPTATPPDGNDARRPSLEQAPTKPDVLVRLENWRGFVSEDGPLGPMHVEARKRLNADLADGMDAISGLRASDSWKLGEVNRLKGELAEHKTPLRRVTQDSEWSCMAADLQSDIEAAIRKPVVPMERPPADQPSAPPAGQESP